jgi:hypothetical protein
MFDGQSNIRELKRENWGQLMDGGFGLVDMQHTFILE